MDMGTGYTMILLGILSAAFFIRWGHYDPIAEILPIFLFSVLPWRCRTVEWIWTRPFFAVSEFCFLAAVGVGLVGIYGGKDVLFGQGVIFLIGIALRDLVRVGLLVDDYGQEFIEKVFNPW